MPDDRLVLPGRDFDRHDRAVIARWCGQPVPEKDDIIIRVPWRHRDDFRVLLDMLNKG